MNYQEALAWLYATQRYGIKLGTDNIKRLLHELRLTFAAHVIHVAGTNGKGSVCAMLDAMCRAANYRTGLFTSPHLISFRERICVVGEKIAEAEVASGLTEIRDLVNQWETHPTFFEITTALALQHFQKSRCEIVILETGLGGRLDATNVVPSSVSVITSVDYDHEKWLGDSLERIAAEKAGIIKPRVPVVSGPLHAEVEAVIRKRASECHASLEIVKEQWTRTPVTLTGSHQKVNASVAIAALRAASLTISDAAIAEGLEHVQWPARFQRWDDRIVIDGAHNPSGALALVQTWREEFGAERATIILAILRDKNASAIMQALAPIARRILLPQIRSERAESPSLLQQIVSAKGLDSEVFGSTAAAISVARGFPERVLIAGSLHFAGEALAFLRGQPDTLEECAQ